MVNTIDLNQDFGYSDYKLTSDDANVIDASDATWRLSNIGDPLNTYPFYVRYHTPGVYIKGGEIVGEVSQTEDWFDIYVNSAAVTVFDSADVTISDWRISRPWDGIRILGAESENFEIKDVYITEARDDAIESDDGMSGVIRDSLLDGVFSGISLGDLNTPESTANNIVTIDNVLVRMAPYYYDGQYSHISPLKTQDTTQQLRILDSVFAVEDPDHLGQSRVQIGWDKTIEASGNYYLNLSDTPFDDDYPLPGEGWTILQGAAAREYWEAARAEWIAEHSDDAESDNVVEIVASEDDFENIVENVEDDDEVEVIVDDVPAPAAAQDDIVDVEEDLIETVEEEQVGVEELALENVVPIIDTEIEEDVTVQPDDNEVEAVVEDVPVIVEDLSEVEQALVDINIEDQISEDTAPPSVIEDAFVLENIIDDVDEVLDFVPSAGLSQAILSVEPSIVDFGVRDSNVSTIIPALVDTMSDQGVNDAYIVRVDGML